MTDEILRELTAIKVQGEEVYKVVDTLKEILNGNGDPSKGMIVRQVRMEEGVNQLKSDIGQIKGGFEGLGESLAACQSERDIRIADERKQLVVSKRWWVGTILVFVAITITIVKWLQVKP